MNKTLKSRFDTLYDLHYDMVFQMCLGFVKGDRNLASDLSQEVFINCWNALDRFKGASSYKTWIYRITVNTCLQYIRKAQTRQHLHADESITEQPTDESNDHYEDLYQAIGQLNEIDRLIIMMVLEEEPYEDIAEAMGVTEATLRVKIHRIKKRLKTILS